MSLENTIATFALICLVAAVPSTNCCHGLKTVEWGFRRPSRLASQRQELPVVAAMTDQEFRELRSMVERRVRDARAFRGLAQKRRTPRFAIKRMDEGPTVKVTLGKSPGTMAGAL